MTEEYSRNLMKVSVAKMLQTIGWNSIHSTPLEILTDISIQYVAQLARCTHDYANEFGCTEPNLDHLGLAFRECHVNLSELEEYVTYVNFGQAPTAVPKYPIPKDDNLNFLKPGSKEVVTRQVHIHEHLPPMYQISDANENDLDPQIKVEEQEENANSDINAQVFKKPAEISPGEPFKRPRLMMEEEGRPTREISSVMMTTSGYISPAREGKLPESRTPLASLDTVAVTNQNTTVHNGNALKANKVLKKQEKKKEKCVGKELFKATPEPKVTSTSNTNSNKINKTLALARLKTEKLNTTITPIPIKPPPHNAIETNLVDKLFTEPDKKKVNILKKISNVKNEKVDKVDKVVKVKEEIKQESRESSPDLIIDETNDNINNKVHISNDITIELIDTTPQKMPEIKQEKQQPPYFDDDSPPGTPSTPKTPEMISQSPPVVNKEKRKRKDKSKVKKVPKVAPISPIRMDYDPGYIDVERPKTPEVGILFQPPSILPGQNMPFPSIFHQLPGLIPPPTPLFPGMGLPGMGLFGLGPPGGPPGCLPPMQPNFNAPIRHNNDTWPMKVHPIEKPQPPAPAPPPAPTPAPPVEQPTLLTPKTEKKIKEHKKEKKDKIKKKNKKDKVKNKAEKKKLKEEKKDKDKIKKEKKEKKKEKELRENLEITIPKLTLKLGTPSPRPDTPDAGKKLNIKPVLKKEVVVEEEELKPKEPEIKREMSPELAKISALVTGQPKPKSNPPPPIVPKEEFKEDSAAVPAQRTHPGPGRPRIHPIKQKSLKPNKRQVPVKDSEGNEVWICPGCGRQDDGSPMIGCDDCDAWYHWVCVGIQVPPDENENWYCRLCIVKKQEVVQSDKKKKRKKREKKEH